MARLEKVLLAAAGLAVAAAAVAAETVRYRYDARGRLVKVERSAVDMGNRTVDYSYDKADNRTNKTTTTGVPK